jgi:hypothetical protein
MATTSRRAEFESPRRTLAVEFQVAQVLVAGRLDVHERVIAYRAAR